jgi:hypothetical protein
VVTGSRMVRIGLVQGLLPIAGSRRAQRVWRVFCNHGLGMDPRLASRESRRRDLESHTSEF